MRLNNPAQEIRLMTYDEAASVYRGPLKEHFRPEEIRPLSVIKEMWDMDCYFAVGMYDQDQELMGYGFLIVEPEERKILLLDHMAILEEYRKQGWGSCLLEALSELFPMKRAILFETEDPDRASMEIERYFSEKRLEFYQRSSAVQTQVKSEICGGHYLNWYIPINGELTDDEVRQALVRIYAAAMPTERFMREVKIQ